jgi:hypothetical protein
MGAGGGGVVQSSTAIFVTTRTSVVAVGLGGAVEAKFQRWDFRCITCRSNAMNTILLLKVLRAEEEYELRDRCE